MSNFIREIKIVTGTTGGNTFPRVSKEGDEASTFLGEVIYETIKVLHPGEYYDNMLLLDGKTILPHHDYYPSFEIWYKLCKEDRFFIDLRHIVASYNNMIQERGVKYPDGFIRKVINDRTCDKWLVDHGHTPMTPKTIFSEEDKLKKKFSFLETKLNFEELKELDEWYENLRYIEV